MCFVLENSRHLCHETPVPLRKPDVIHPYKVENLFSCIVPVSTLFAFFTICLCCTKLLGKTVYLMALSAFKSPSCPGCRKLTPPGNGPYCFWIHSQIYCLVSLLCPNKATKPGHDMDNFVFTILLKQQPNGLQMIQAKGIWPDWCNNWTRCCNKFTHLLCHVN
jgi:hypothetical protein